MKVTGQHSWVRGEKTSADVFVYKHACRSPTPDCSSANLFHKVVTKGFFVNDVTFFLEFITNVILLICCYKVMLHLYIHDKTASTGFPKYHPIHSNGTYH